MAKKKILVITDNMPWGHRSIARAIYGFLKSKEKEENIEVCYSEVKAETGISNDFYTFMYRFFPKSNKMATWLSEDKRLREIVHRMSEINLPRIKKVVQGFKPDLVISCYWFHSHSLQWWRKNENKDFKLWSIIADPWTITPATVVPGVDLTLVYDQIGEKGARKYGLRGDILKSGWWVRREMYEKNDRKTARLKLGINDGRPVIFIGGGSLGTNSLTRLLPVLMMIKTKCAFVFNTGTDKLLHSTIEEYMKLLKRMKLGEEIIVKNLAWIDNMAEVLTASDIVFGKAGPNFLFDVVASQKPFVAITHIGGQEDGNVEIIKKKRLGWVKEKPGEAADFLLEYLKKPEYYQKMYSKNIKKEAENNQKSMEIILKRLKKDLEI
ncbi:MAG: glycosyltransferase [Candidatus Shapirobacteria bacterium]|jgi:processive 1,2-diacylglycerol beta-glucosyltransferase